MSPETLQSVDILRFLDSDSLHKLTRLCKEERFEKDNIIFYEGDKPRWLYILLQGEVKIYKSGPGGAQTTLHRFNTPSLLAEMAVIEDIAYPATCLALRSCTLARIKQEDLLHLLQEDRNFSFAFIKSLNKKIKTLEETINTNMILSGTKRIYTYIYNHPEDFAAKKKVTVAKELNVTPETLSRVTTALRKKGIVASDFSLKDPRALEELL